MVSTTKFDSVDQNLVSLTKNFDSSDQKFGCPTPHHFLIGTPKNDEGCITKNEGQSDKNFGQPIQIAILLNQPSQKVESAYKISMSVKDI